MIGSSHGNLVGVIIDGAPIGYEISIEQIKDELRKRRPNQSEITTPRDEKDILVIEAGIKEGKTNGEPIVAYVRNEDKDSTYYEKIKNTPRPGHADFVANTKYEGFNDPKGGGRFSGRMTLGLVIAGSISRQILEKLNISFKSYTKEIGPIIGKNNILSDDEIYDKTNLVRAADPIVIDDMKKYILEIKNQGDSCGGIIETTIEGLPIGVGEPWFESIESKLSSIIFSIPAVKGIEFGKGFQASKMKGSEHNDQMNFDEDDQMNYLSNNAGGIIGGLSNGERVIFRVAFKPTSSISIKQQTVDVKSGESTNLEVKGRHDPCIVPRAVPVVQNTSAIAIIDLMIEGNLI